MAPSMDLAMKTSVWIWSHKELKLPTISFDFHAPYSFELVDTRFLLHISPSQVPVRVRTGSGLVSALRLGNSAFYFQHGKKNSCVDKLNHFIPLDLN